MTGKKVLSFNFNYEVKSNFMFTVNPRVLTFQYTLIKMTGKNELC